MVRKAGGIAIFMNGAQGGMVTADNRRPGGEEAGDCEECIRIGELLADQALAIVDKAPLQTAPTLFATSKEIKLPVTSPLMRMLIDNAGLKLNITEDYTLSTTVNLLNIGSAQILTIPGEALPNIGYYLKRKMNTDHPFLFGLTNDAFGYMLTKEDFNSFKRYEYVSKTSLGEETAEVYIEEALQLIAESPGAENH